MASNVGQDISHTVIVFDLETTGLIVNGVMPHITQLAAVELASMADFNCYILPKVPIQDGARSVNGMTVAPGVNGPVLTVFGEEKETLTLKAALEGFMTWLDQEQFTDIILIAHNCNNFDFPVLKSALKVVGEWESFQEKIAGFADSLPLMRAKYPQMQNHRQEYLVRTILGETYDAHRAESDVKALARLLLRSSLTDDDIENNQL